ncbi:transposase [Fulvivirga imtechensis AK7]|uniref:Transposase n=2 Tax=Fulvivirga TaxID=396811 RepID=L8JTD6_9BACT|nr:transposase [Fulvivirga imtechensis AK7]
MIIGQAGGANIEHIVRDMKKYTSFEITSAIESNDRESRKDWMLRMFEYNGRKNPNNKKYQFWQQHNQPLELNTNELMQQKLDYIHQNPVKTGIVLSPEEYLYSSAKNYYGLAHEALLDVIIIE